MGAAEPRGGGGGGDGGLFEGPRGRRCEACGDANTVFALECLLAA